MSPTNDPFADLATGSTSSGADPFADLAPETPPTEPAPPSLGDKAKAVAKAAPGVLKDLGVGLLPWIPAATTAATKNIPAVQLGFLAGTAAKGLQDVKTVSDLKQIQSEVPTVDQGKTAADYYAKLFLASLPRDGLLTISCPRLRLLPKLRPAY